MNGLDFIPLSHHRMIVNTVGIISEPVKSTMDEAKVSPVAFETKDGL